MRVTDSYGGLTWFGVFVLACIPASIIGVFLFWAASLIPTVSR